jgi:type I restriction enzyme S subunit
MSSDEAVTLSRSLADICVDVSYGYTASASSDPVGPRFLRITDIQGGRFDWFSVPYCEADERELQKYRLEVGDIVVARTGNSTGENAQVWSEPPDAVFASYLIRFRVDPKLANPFFVGYQLRSERFRQHVLAVRSGSAQPGANAKQLGTFAVHLPSWSAQELAVEVLRALDDRIALLRETNATLEAIAQALFKSWFVDFDPVRAKSQGLAPAGMDEATAALFPDGFEDSALGPVPAGWPCIDLGELTRRFGGAIQTGPFGSQLHAKDYVDIGIPVVMPKDILGRRVSTESVARVGATDVERLSRHKLQNGDIVFSRRGDVERHALITEREVGWLCGTGCLLVRPGPAWQSPGFLSLLLDAPRARTWLVQHAVGATMPNLNVGILSSVPLVLPPPDLLAAFDAVVAATEEQRSRNATMAETLAEIRDALLPRLISGQLRLPEAALTADPAPTH